MRHSHLIFPTINWRPEVITQITLIANQLIHNFLFVVFVVVVDRLEIIYFFVDVAHIPLSKIIIIKSSYSCNPLIPLSKTEKKNSKKKTRNKN